jgi:hypothetical protein
VKDKKKNFKKTPKPKNKPCCRKGKTQKAAEATI